MMAAQQAAITAQNELSKGLLWQHRSIDSDIKPANAAAFCRRCSQQLCIYQ
jgi:hypothetical protein